MCVCVCVCVCTRMNQKEHRSEVCVIPLAECVRLYDWGDVKIHGKLSSLNDKHANFVWTNVFSIVVSFPMLAVVWSCTWWNIWGCGSVWVSKSADVVEDTSTWLFCPTRFSKLLNLFLCLTIFVSETSEFLIEFSRTFHCLHSLPTI